MTAPVREARPGGREGQATACSLVCVHPCPLPHASSTHHAVSPWQPTRAGCQGPALTEWSKLRSPASLVPQPHCLLPSPSPSQIPPVPPCSCHQNPVHGVLIVLLSPSLTPPLSSLPPYPSCCLWAPVSFECMCNYLSICCHDNHGSMLTTACSLPQRVGVWRHAVLPCQIPAMPFHHPSQDCEIS